jgi:hypothetical protein
MVANHDSVILVTPLNDRARRNLIDHVDDDAHWFGRSLVVEPRYLDGFAHALAVDGFTVEWEGR